VRLEKAAPERWLLVLRDVTEVREAVRRRDRFLAMLSHELRNPLAALTSAAQILQLGQAPPDAGGRPSPSQAPELARTTLERQVRHVTRLVDGLLDVSRFLHGKIHLLRQPVDLADVVGRAAQAHRAAFEGEGKRLAVAAPPPLPVRGDAARLTQV